MTHDLPFIHDPVSILVVITGKPLQKMKIATDRLLGGHQCIDKLEFS